MYNKKAFFRFYEELNDFLPQQKRKTSFEYHFYGNPAIKDAIEAIGVPHPEIDLIIVNNHSVGFDYILQSGDFVSVYPVFESLNIEPILKLRAKPLRHTKFIVDVNLGKLARLLRLCGFDSLYDRRQDDADLVSRAVRDKRIILTRDQQLLKRSNVTHGYWVRNTSAYEQLHEVLQRFDLKASILLFSRCMVCNGTIVPVEMRLVIDKIPHNAAKFCDEYFQCAICRKIYWRGSHYHKLHNRIQSIIDHL